MNTMDEDLVARAAGGDRDALCQLLEEHGTGVRGALAGAIPKRWQSMLAIDDVMQETYTDAFLDVSDFVSRGRGSFQRWLATIAKHNLLNAIQMLEAEKRGGNRRRIGSEMREDSYVSLYDRLGGTTTTPSRHLARREARTALQHAIEQLPEDYRRAVQLYDLEGRPIEELSSVLKRRPGAVFMLRARAHRALRRILGATSKYLSSLG